jgi:hypothetical protein
MNDCPYRQSYRFLDYQFRLGSDCREFMAHIEYQYPRFRLTGEEPDDSDAYYLIRSDPTCRPYLFDQARNRFFDLVDPPLLVIQAYLILFQRILENMSSHFFIHGAALAWQGRGVVILGDSGFGKTTLTIELVKRGLTFLSDEFATIQRRTRLLTPFPRNLGIRPNSPFYPEILDRLGQGQMEKLLWINGKAMVDLGDWLGCQPGLAVPIDTLFMVKEGLEKPDHTLMRLSLIRKNPELLATIASIPGIVCQSQQRSAGGAYDSYFLVPQGGGKMARLSALISQASRDVLACDNQAMPRTFETEPRCEPLDPQMVVMAMLEFWRNRWPDGGILQETKGKILPVWLELMQLIRPVRCFLLTPGHLPEMANMIMTALDWSGLASA